MVFHPCRCCRFQLGLRGGGGKHDVGSALHQPLIGGDSAAAPDDALRAIQYGVITSRFRIHRLSEGGVDRIQGRSPIQGQVPGLLRGQPQGGRLFQPCGLGIFPKGGILPQQISPAVIYRGDAGPPSAKAAVNEAQGKDSQGPKAHPPLCPPGQPLTSRQGDHRQRQGHRGPAPQSVLSVWRPAGKGGEQDHKQQKATVKDHGSRCRNQGG